MFKKFMQNLAEKDEDRTKLVIDFMVDLSDDDYKRITEAVKLYRKGESLREDYYDKGNMVLQAKDSSTDFIEVNPEEVQND